MKQLGKSCRKMKIQDKTKRLLLATLSGIILSLGWTELGIGPLLFIGFVPLLIIEDHFSIVGGGGFKLFLYGWWSFFLWAVLSFWGMFYASWVGTPVVILLSSLFMASIFWLFHTIKKRMNTGFGFFGWICFWLSYEYFVTHSDLNYPWLNLGNAFASNIEIVQWYEFTGVPGGSFWILLVNILFFLFYKELTVNPSSHKIRGIAILLVVVLVIPLSGSLYLFSTFEEKGIPCNVLIVQPNIDPYDEKYVRETSMEHVEMIRNMALENCNDSTDYIIAPETAIQTGVWLNKVQEDTAVQVIHTIVEKFPRAKMIIGMNCTYLYDKSDTVPFTAEIYEGTNYYYDYFNTAIQIDSTPDIPYYHKSKQVIGPEKMPWAKYLDFLNDFIMDFGGHIGTNGFQKTRSVFSSSGNEFRVGPIICYESLFGEFVTEYVTKGANLLIIITNDGWWADSPIYRLHLSFSRLRAIETRRSIARCANTGISCLINQKGEIISRTKGWEKTTLMGGITTNEQITFYVERGDFISKIALFFGTITLLIGFVRGRIRG